MELVRCPAELGTASRTVIVSSVSSDSHTWNLVYLQLVLEEAGCRVVNLGPCAPDQLIVAECLKNRPDLLVVSTVNGHGFQDGSRLIRVLRNHSELRQMPVVIGGKLGISGPDHRSSASLIDAGFDGVFEEDADIQLFRSFVAALPVGVTS
ncbi:cobalamin B12-binding domain-containing protein [Micromonospora orduensis]|uniref:cobalamin B12-binding domain-containing protein n=1 Tax=Micromonospora orduensis TaxID=1420891 RepID=UPI003814EBCC